MSVTNGKEYKLAIRIAGIVDKTFNASLNSVNASLKTKLGKLDASFTQLDAGFNKIMQVGQRTFRAIATATGIAATAIGAASIGAIKVGADFEKQMSTVEAVSGATGSQMDILTEKARELGRTSVFSAVEVGQAMEYMGMAGWNAEQMITGIDGVLNLAAASGEDLARVSDIVTDNLTAFHLTAEDTNQMVDAMAQAAMNANTNVDKMGESFKYAGAVMGSTFESSGTQFEDTAIAIALMANNGIKASIAGTALRNMITRMVKPTKESQAAIDRLGLSLQDDEGNVYSFLEVMRQLRTGFSEISDTVEKEAIAAMLGGQRGMNGLLAIAEATESDFNDLTDAIYNAQGAAEKMADIRLDNLAGDVTLFKDAVADLGIEFEQQNDGILRKIVQKATDIVGGLGQKIPEAVSKFTKKVETEIPKLNMKYKKYIKPIIDVVGNGLKWLLSHGELVISILAGIGGAMAAFKIGQSAVKFMNWIMGLGGAAGPIMGVVTVIGLLTTAIVAYKQHMDELNAENFAEHFGDIKLSMEDIQRVVDNLTGFEKLGQMKQALEEFGKLDGIKEQIRESVETLNKYNWMVSIGIELNEEDAENYKSAIDEYVKAAEDYILQEQYAVTLNIQATISEETLQETNFVDTLNEFYAGRYGELQALGTELRDAVNDAFSDGLLTFDETQTIAKLQQKTAEIQKGLSESELDATIKTLELKLSGGDLDPTSFLAVLEKGAEAVEKNAETIQNSYAKSQFYLDQAMQSELQAASETSTTLDEVAEKRAAIYEKYAKLRESGTTEYLSDILKNVNKFFGFGMNSITGQYSEELEAAVPKMQSILDTFYKNAFDPSNVAIDGVLDTSAFQSYVDSMQSQISGVLAPEDRSNIQQILEDLKPTQEEVERVANEYRTKGEEIPKSIVEGLQAFNILDALANAGATGGLWTMIQAQLDESGDLEVLKGALKDNGATLPPEIATGIEENVSAVQPGITSLYTNVGQMLTTTFGVGFDVPVSVRLAYDISSGGGMPSSVASAIRGFATGGIVSQKQIAWVAEDGPEAIIPLDNSQNALELWMRAGELLGQTGSLFDNIDIGGEQPVSAAEVTPQFVYSPVQNFYGNTDAEAVHEANQRDFAEFERMMNEYTKRNRRTGFG